MAKSVRAIILLTTLLFILPSDLGIRRATAAAMPGSNVQEGLNDFAQARFAEALQRWQIAAETGDSTAALYVGVMYDAGQGVPQSYTDAIQWYRRAGEAGNAAGSFNVGVMYDAGRGVPVDRVQAANWYAKAAAKGFPRAEYNLGLLLQEGDGVPRNLSRATVLFRAAYAHGVAAAGVHLSQLGQRVIRSSSGPGPAVADAALQDFQKAQQMLVARGAVETGRAAELFHQAAERHNPLAEYDYGYCLENGLGVPQDKIMAYAWYHRAFVDAKDDRLHSIAEASASALETHLSRSDIDTARRFVANMP